MEPVPKSKYDKMSVSKILVLEHDPTLRMLVQRQIKGVNCHLETEAVASGEESIKRFDNDICLIFMDIGLPGIDGCETAKKFEKRNCRWERAIKFP